MNDEKKFHGGCLNCSFDTDNRDELRDHDCRQIENPKINLESFMLEVFQLSGMTFDTFHKMFRYINERHFGNNLYQEIKNDQISVTEVAQKLKAAI